MSRNNQAVITARIKSALESLKKITNNVGYTPVSSAEMAKAFGLNGSVLSFAAKFGVIEKHQDKRGCYRWKTAVEITDDMAVEFHKQFLLYKTYRTRNKKPDTRTVATPAEAKQNNTNPVSMLDAQASLSLHGTLKSFTDRDLANELKSRGYEVEVFQTIRQRVTF